MGVYGVWHVRIADTSLWRTAWVRVYEERRVMRTGGSVWSMAHNDSRWECVEDGMWGEQMGIVWRRVRDGNRWECVEDGA